MRYSTQIPLLTRACCRLLAWSSGVHGGLQRHPNGGVLGGGDQILGPIERLGREIHAFDADPRAPLLNGRMFLRFISFNVSRGAKDGGKAPFDSRRLKCLVGLS